MEEKILSRMRRTSALADELKGSEIIKLAGEIKEQIASGKHIYNFTIGDFNPEIFPLPEALKRLIVEAYDERQTNYPASNGMLELRKTLSNYTLSKQNLQYKASEFLVAGGARPLIYAAFQAIVDRDEPTLYPVPSWNNNHYTTLSHGRQLAVETGVEDNFMPTAAKLESHIKKAGLLALCSPLNPTGTVFSKENLKDICQLVIDENKKREGKRKPLYIIYDQIYWQLCHNETEHQDPVNLMPEMRPYTIYIDGLSKAFAATGVRVGWAFGPQMIIDKMKSILGHLGAWAPKPEQIGSSAFLENPQNAEEFLKSFNKALNKRLDGFYKVFKKLKSEGMPVDAVEPQAAIYLTVNIDLKGMQLPDGNRLETGTDTTQYLLNHAGIALVPFTAFGASTESTWYRLSVGTAKLEDIEIVENKLRDAINRLS